MHSGCEHLDSRCIAISNETVSQYFCFVMSTFVSHVCRGFPLWGVWWVWGVFVGVVVSVLGRSVDALAPGADEGRGRPR